MKKIYLQNLEPKIKNCSSCLILWFPYLFQPDNLHHFTALTITLQHFWPSTSTCTLQLFSDGSFPRGIRQATIRLSLYNLWNVYHGKQSSYVCFGKWRFFKYALRIYWTWTANSQPLCSSRLPYPSQFVGLWRRLGLFIFEFTLPHFFRQIISKLETRNTIPKLIKHLYAFPFCEFIFDVLVYLDETRKKDQFAAVSLSFPSYSFNVLFSG